MKFLLALFLCISCFFSLPIEISAHNTSNDIAEIKENYDGYVSLTQLKKDKHYQENYSYIDENGMIRNVKVSIEYYSSSSRSSEWTEDTGVLAPGDYINFTVDHIGLLGTKVSQRMRVTRASDGSIEMDEHELPVFPASGVKFIDSGISDYKTTDWEIITEDYATFETSIQPLYFTIHCYFEVAVSPESDAIAWRHRNEY